MRLKQSIEAFLKIIAEWAERDSNILGVLLVGSHAHGTEKPDSDIDLILLTHDYSSFISDQTWTEKLGKVVGRKDEDWGEVKAVRTFYLDGLEVEFNFALVSWATARPIDPGTYRVVSDGSKIIYDPLGIFQALHEDIEG